MAASIWRAYYPSVISSEQIEYMLQTMYSADVIRREMADGVVWELVWNASDAGDEPVGYLSFAHDVAAGTTKLHKLYVLPRLHGQGIGRLMIDRVKAAAAEAGARSIHLQVNKRNPRAIRAYERSGFLITDSIVCDIGGGFVMDDYVMNVKVEK